MNKLNKFKKAIKNLYSSVDELRDVFPEKPFTLDGRIVGDIGEAIASLKFKVVLDKKLRRDWDGYRIGPDKKKREVQIKTTQKDRICLKKPPCDGDLLVFKISRDEWKCCYDGSILKVWKLFGCDKTDKKIITLNQLEKIK